MIATADYCRENRVPYFGICLGMQISVIAFARSVAGMADANSGEFDPESTHKVIDFLPDQSDSVAKGGHPGGWGPTPARSSPARRCLRLMA